MSGKAMGRVLTSDIKDRTMVLMLVALADSAHEDGSGAYPSLRLLARKARISVRHAQRLLRIALEHVWIVVQSPSGQHRPTTYRLVYDALDSNSGVTFGESEVTQLCRSGVTSGCPPNRQKPSTIEPQETRSNGNPEKEFDGFPKGAAAPLVPPLERIQPREVENQQPAGESAAAPRAVSDRVGDSPQAAVKSAPSPAARPAPVLPALAEAWTRILAIVGSVSLRAKLAEVELVRIDDGRLVLDPPVDLVQFEQEILAKAVRYYFPQLLPPPTIKPLRKPRAKSGPCDYGEPNIARRAANPVAYRRPRRGVR
jgi:hypothetical protein